MNSFYEHHKDSINWHYRCFDRILLNGLIQPFQQPERVVGFFSTIARRATPRSLVHTDVSDRAWPQADRGNSYNPASASPNPRRNPHSARSTAPAYVPRFRAFAFWTPAATVRGRVRHMPASKNLHKSRLRVACKIDDGTLPSTFSIRMVFSAQGVSHHERSESCVAYEADQ
jgi:hypothetical protein